MNSCAVSTSESVSRCSERETVLCIVMYSSDFLKMSKHSLVESFDTELFINEIQQLPAIWDSGSSSYSNKKMHGKHYADLAVRQTTSVTCKNT